LTRELFVYWRTAAATADAAEREVQAWQHELRAAHRGLRALLYRRADEAAPWVTLMEVYAAEADPGSELATEVAAAARALEQHLVDEGNRRLARWIAGERKVEVFELRGEAA
jgi:hypothetical protein